MATMAYSACIAAVRIKGSYGGPGLGVCWASAGGFPPFLGGGLLGLPLLYASSCGITQYLATISRK